jgi:hypothetical protein
MPPDGVFMSGVATTLASGSAFEYEQIGVFPSHATPPGPTDCMIAEVPQPQPAFPGQAEAEM